MRNSNHRIRKNTKNNAGYYVVSFKRDGKSVIRLIHRLVAIEFIPNTDRNKDCINHIDGNKLNNYLENLEWCTKKHNNLHAISTGLYKANKPVVSKNIETGEVAEYSSAREAERITGVDYRQISDTCREKQKYAHGYYWNFL